MIVLIVAIGLLNIGLGFGLAVYYGYGPPGLDGIFEALGPMPPTAADSPPFFADGAGVKDAAVVMETDQPAAVETIAPTSEEAVEEEVLDDVRDLAATAQTAMDPGHVESR